MTQRRLPYIDYLLNEFERGNAAVEKSFGRHVHWGYWDDPGTAVGDDDDYARAAERLTQEVCAAASIAEGDRVLDAGCGFGGTLASLNERFGSLRLVGLNIEGRQLARAAGQVMPLPGNWAAFCQADACALPFSREIFDRVLAVECVFHFPSRESFFREAHRVLRPGGTLALTDFVPAAGFMPISGLKLPKRFEAYNVFGSYNLRCTVGRYRRLAADTGFAVTAARNLTGNILPTYRYLQRLAAADASSNKRTDFVKYLIGLQRLLGRTGLLNYYLLSFRKPTR
jgi:ubiquinone/menaquinone biosynthesis C-methylase UbiE